MLLAKALRNFDVGIQNVFNPAVFRGKQGFELLQVDLETAVNHGEQSGGVVSVAFEGALRLGAQ
ncbi:hypothetical protein SDC9_125768 [bioreactor metagenome]|uniref:Uncharacterized protein n=1 Tax=bioreactor metagenome TaxID=1076179 RepID=A0A645CPC5_9ZZZZ